MAKLTRKTRAAGDGTEGRMIYIVQSGPYSGQQLLMQTVHADAAIADGWGVEIGEALAPNDTPATVGGEPPQSFNDWLADAMVPGIPEPPPEPPAAPVISALNPSEAETGSADVTMHVTGTGFTPASVIVFNGFDEPIVFVSDTDISTIVKPSIFGEGVLPVEVRDEGGTSNSLDFTFTAPPETIVGRR
jgi:hypothetical protein